MTYQKVHTIDAEYEAGPNDDPGYGFRRMMVCTWYYKIKFVISTTISVGFRTYRCIDKRFTIQFSDREINDERLMLQIVKRSLSRDAMSFSIYADSVNADITLNDECVEYFHVTPQALETFEYLKTLIPKNVKMIENFLTLPDGNTQ